MVSVEVLREALRNLRLKFDRSAVSRFYNLLGTLQPSLAEPVGASAALDLPTGLASKDHHIVLSCLGAGAAVCLTLDRRHLLTDEVRRWGLERDLRFLTPREFLVWERLRPEPGV